LPGRGQKQRPDRFKEQKVDYNGIAIVIGALVAAVAIIGVIVSISRLLLICSPNEILVISGRKRALTDGRVVGYRIIKGGRTMRVPMLEKFTRMSLETIPLELSIQNAYSRGGIPLKVEAIANVKINSTEPALGNAVERFLSKRPEAIYKIAKDTLEGNLRGVLATLTPEEVNEDRLKFAASLIDEADNDLQQLGLQLDTLKIQNVSDDAGYLNSLGRRKTAEVVAEARKAEAEKTAEAEQMEAQARERAQIAKTQADRAIQEAEINKERELGIARTKSQQQVQTATVDMEREIQLAKTRTEQATKEAEIAKERELAIARAQSEQAMKSAEIEKQKNVDITQYISAQEVQTKANQARVQRAELEKTALIKENEATVAGEKSKVKFEQELERERILLQQQRLTADVIEPAKARKEAMELEAKGQAAASLEAGYAKIKVLEDMIASYQKAGSEGERIFMLTILPDLVKTLADTVGQVKIERLSVIDSGNGSGLSKAVSQFPQAVVALMEQVRAATGVDILDLVRGASVGALPPADRAGTTPDK
jgi:flotillin